MTQTPHGRPQRQEPEEASHYGDESVITPIQRFTRQQQLELLDWHPLFTGRCPECERVISLADLTQIRWDCPHCDWKDDNIVYQDFCEQFW